jgi:alkaline phosphatase/streptomycin-6-phosphatase
MQIKRGPLLTAGGLGVIAALAVSTSFAFGGTENHTNGTRAALDGSTPKNVILFIGDGMGTQEITAARYYQGVKNPLNVDRMPFTGFDTTWSVKGDGVLPDYDPDSASTGTMWATGKKTIDERISQSPTSSVNLPGTAYQTALEYSQSIGKKTGDVSTAEITDATPAVQASHMSLRGCQGPANMDTGVAATSCVSEQKSKGGLGSIAEQEIDHQVDVLLGGGRARFEQVIPAGEPGAGKKLTEVATDKGFQYVTDASGLAAVTDASKPVLGLFTAGNMTQEWAATTAKLGKGDDAAPCVENNRPANEPSLSAMTQKAIDLLENDKGFFLQVEGASIDKRDHAADACGQLGETVAYDNAIGVALDYQKTHPDTLVLVTADHAHTSQIVSEDASGSGLPTGFSSNVTTKDGQTLSLTYGTAGYQAGAAPTSAFGSMQHTGAVVPVWAVGPQAANVLGTNDHTDLFDLIRFAKTAQAPPSETTTVTVPGPTTTVTTPVPGPTRTATTTVPGPTTTVTQTVTAPSAASSQPQGPDFAASAAVPGSAALKGFRARGLEIAYVTNATGSVSVRITAGGKTLATGSDTTDEGSGELVAKPTSAGRRAKPGKATVKVTISSGTVTPITTTKTVTLG